MRLDIPIAQLSFNKILLLGGSTQQIIAIETAKKLGYYTVLCDYLLIIQDNMLQISSIL